MSDSYQVRFKSQPDPKHSGGYILTFSQVGDITHDESPLKVIFDDQVKLVGAFLKAGIYLHSYGTLDSGKDVLPDPGKTYDVDDAMLRDLGFDIPA
jgi:hypothetical protein